VLRLQLAGDALQSERLSVVEYDRKFGVGVAEYALDGLYLVLQLFHYVFRIHWVLLGLLALLLALEGAGETAVLLEALEPARMAQGVLAAGDQMRLIRIRVEILQAVLAGQRGVHS
jgi:uncharacterized membrane protein